MENSLGSFDPNVLPMDAFTLSGKASDASRTLGLKAPWIFGESTHALTSDLALRANGSIKWTLGTAYEPDDVVYHDEDGLWYMNLAATSTIEPDYSDTGVEGVTWKWVAGVIGGFVSGRGWWVKFADGTLIQYGSISFTMVVSVAIGYNITFPIAFSTSNAGDHPLMSSVSPATHWDWIHRGNDNITSSTGGNVVISNFGAAQSAVCRWIAIGRWKA